MKSSMSMDLALFSQNFASCKTLSIFLLMLKSAGTSCKDGGHDSSFQLADVRPCHFHNHGIVDGIVELADKTGNYCLLQTAV